MLIAHSEPHREFHRVPKELAVTCVPGKYYRSSRSLAATQPLLKAAMRRVKLGRGIGTFCNGLKGSTQCQNIVSAARRKECDNNKNVGGHHRRHPQAFHLVIVALKGSFGNFLWRETLPSLT